MRNLKKILALVLALIMSLSLMATAGATDFKDDADVSDTYRQAVEVLSELGVFNGDQNGQFNPGQPIKRSEVAAILYRIATGDIGLEGNKTYAPYNQFPDVTAEDWYAGYVTYCANAGYIKGRNTGKFDAKDDVTGYEVLAMILRAVGYDKNNEFVGRDWQLNTASIAREKGVLANVLEDPAVRLSEPATREVVAELLFRASLLPQVIWNAATLSYREDGETLGMKNFGLEGVSGVVTANQWANINDDAARVLDDGVTELRLADGSAYTIDRPTDLDAVGQTYIAYVAGMTSDKRALTLDLSDGNTVAFNEGKSVNVASLDDDETHTNKTNDQGYTSIAALAAQKGISLNADTLYYLNYDLDYNEWQTTDIVIRYAVAKANVDGIVGDSRYPGNLEWLRYKNDVAAGTMYPGHKVESRTIRVNWDENGDGTVDAKDTLDCWVFTIQPENDSSGSWAATRINGYDLEIMQEIFYNADRLGTNNTENNNYNTQNYVYGEVYTGTTSMTDESDTLSWKQFQDKYFIDSDANAYAGCGNGNSIRVIDNDGDNVAEYVFKVTYHQDKAITSYNDTLEFCTLVPGSNTVWDEEKGADSFEVGDVVNYRTIDGKTTVWKAEKITDTIKDKSFKNITVTPTGGDALGQSDIANETGMSDDIMNMLDKTEYNMYLDEFGFIRTYELAQGSRYALVTEIYPTNRQAHNYVTTNSWIAEVQAGDADIDEYTISNASGNPFITSYAWTSRVTRYSDTDDLNYLQPAVAHLGMIPSGTALTSQFMGATTGNNPAYTDNGWNRGVFAMADAADTAGARSLRASAIGDYGVFDYGAEGTELHSASFTNVAAYTMGDGTVSLSTAAQLATDKDGNQLYRVGGALVNGCSPYGTPGKQLVPGVSGTKQQLKDLWVSDNTVAATGAIVVDGLNITGDNPTASAISAAAENWWNNNYSGSTSVLVDKDGTRIYPVYLVDYIQLAAQDVSSTLRHYAIDGNYNTYFNANSNNYVNAVADTEFYVVMPNRVAYYASYADLPTIAARDIRAMYAVATNTSANASGIDFWTANVIVIETSGLVSDYDSISLMYYNPWENTASVRYVDSLNNQWRTYGAADPDMTVVPAAVTGANAAWGNQSWGNGNDQYGFYKLYSTEYNADADELAADSAAIISSDWNANHIYAGTIRRLSSEIANSNYIDVDLKGRADIPGGQDDASVVAVGIRYNNGEVPIYRVNRQSVTSLRLAPNSTSNEVEVGDKIIWVTDRSGNVAYIVDLGPRSGYTAPGYLLGTVNSVYERIVAEQTANATVSTPSWQNVDLSVDLGAYQTITFSGADLRNAPVTLTNDTASSATLTGTLILNGREAGARLQVSVQDTHSNAYGPIAIAGFTGATSGWTVPAGGLALNTDGRTYTLQLNNTIALPGRTAMGFIGVVVYTQARIDQLIADAAKTVGTEISEKEMVAVRDELRAIAAWTDPAVTADGAAATVAVVTVPSGVTPAAGMTPAADADSIDEFNTKIDSEVSTAEGKAVAVTTANPAYSVNPTAFEKASLAGKTITITAASGYVLSGDPTVKISSTTLTKDSDYTYADGVITFKESYTTEPAGDILITITATSTATPAADLVPTMSGDSQNMAAPTITDGTKVGDSLANKVITIDVESGAKSNGYGLPTANGISVAVNGQTISNTNYTYAVVDGVGKITFKPTCTMTANTIVVTASAVAPTDVPVSVTGTGVEIASPATFDFNSELNGKVITIKLAAGQTDKVLPDSVTVSVAGTPATDKFSYDKTTGKITFTQSVKATGKIVVTASAANELVTLTVTGTGIADVDATNIDKGSALSDVAEVTITEADNYTLTGGTVSITMGSETLSSSTDYTWTDSTGKIAFKGDKTVTGNIVITVTAVREQVNVTLSGSGAANLTVDRDKLDKGSDLKRVTITIENKSGSGTMPADASKITIAVNSGNLTQDDDWTYNSTTGAITFTESCTAKASTDVTITLS